MRFEGFPDSAAKASADAWKEHWILLAMLLPRITALSPCGIDIWSD